MAHTPPSLQDGCLEECTDPPLQGLVLASHTWLEKAQSVGRLKCPTCSGSRMFFCYTCCGLVGLSPEHVPTVKLPVKIDIIKHPNETDGKSTAIHAKILAPDDVSIYTYPCIPEFDQQAQKVVLVFPGPDAMVVEELARYFCIPGEEGGEESPADERIVKKIRVEEHTSTPQHTDHAHKHTCSVQRVIFIDSTWNQTTRIITDERLQALPQVELKSRKTCFWRHQRGSPDTYLATIEAIYYFLKDFHVHCLLREYHGEYDNLLFFYSFLHKLINKAKKEAGKS